MIELLQEVEQFLFNEARLLDERRWADWLALFAADGMYWVPLARGQTDPVNHVSLFFEDALMRSVRARRLDERNAWSQQPPARTQHLIGNVQVDNMDHTGDVVTARSAFHMIHWQRGEQMLLGGACTHRLVREGGLFRIALKRIDLVNCDAAHHALEVFL